MDLLYHKINMMYGKNNSRLSGRGEQNMNRTEGKNKHRGYIIGVVICLCLLCLNVPTVNGEIQKKTIKVACFLYDGYFQIMDDGSYYGYGFDYLDEIARYTGWEYEYMFGTWSECIEMLDSGQADLMPMFPKSDDRLESYEYTENSTNKTTLCMVASEDCGYEYEDFQQFNGMKVGVLDDDEGNAMLSEYCDNNGFTVSRFKYTNIKSALEDINNGTIDAVVTGDIADMDGYVVIGNISVQKYYMASPKGKKDIVEAADKALERIGMEQPSFETSLTEKYFEKGKNTTPIYTADEKEYIKNAGIIRVALYGERNILSQYNKGEFSGMTYDIMEIISKKTGLSFEYSNMAEGVRGYEYFEDDKADIIAPVTTNRFVELSDKVQELPIGLSTSFVMIGRREYVFSPYGEFKIVINKNLYGADKTLKEIYPNAEIVYVESQEECLDMVVADEADVTFDNKFVALYRLRSPFYTNDLTIYEAWSADEDVSMILPVNADERLVSVLNKAIGSITGTEFDSVIIDNTASSSYEYSVGEFMYKFRYYIGAGVIAAAVMICMIVFIFIQGRRNKYNEEKRTADEKYKKHLYYQANFDSMTGMLNRNGFYDRTRKVIDENQDIKFVILRADIDRFKVFNDIMGVKAGDELIKYVADKWKEYFSGQLGTYGYFGGDDYICCCPYSAFNREEFMDKVNGWFEAYKRSYAVSISVGAYIIDDLDKDVNIMCDRAELALEKAKTNKETHFCFYERSMREQVVKEQDIVNYIPTAFEEEQFEIYLQPQYDSVTKKIVGAEALTRWKHPEQGMISPGVFIPVMESNGMITKLDMYVVEHVCRILKRLYEEENVTKDFSIAVNLSRVDAFNCDIMNRITGLLDKYNVPISGIRLEITESAYVDQHDQVSDFVRELKEKGFMIEMDDFGSGYSSLNALKDVPIDTLKLDLRFLAGDNSKKGGIIINSVIRMAKWLNIPVIAEGVENIKQVNYLRNVGCHYMQGFYFAKPMPVREFVELLGENKVEGISRGIYTNELTYTEEVLDTNSINSKVLEKIGPVAIAEYYQGNLEAVILNDSFYGMINVTREEYEPYRCDMLAFLKEEQRVIFKDMLKSLKNHDSVMFKYPIDRGNGNGIEWTKCRMSVLSSLEQRKTIAMLFTDVTEEVNDN